MAPPATEPAPGKNLSKFATIVLPAKVAPAPVRVEDTKVARKDFLFPFQKQQ